MINQIHVFKELPEVTASFSTRAKAGDEVREELADRGLLVIRPVQVHRDHVELVTEEMRRECLREGHRELVFPDTDAVITACRGTALTTVHADCLPVWLYDEETGAMGLAHAGWRGTCAAIAVKMARAMEEKLGARRRSMRAAVGPGISLCCFEVGPEVYDAFVRRYDFIDSCAERAEGGKYRLDLKEINRRQLAAFGIERTEVSPLCTVCSKSVPEGAQLFYSYRRDNGIKERMTASLYASLPTVGTLE